MESKAACTRLLLLLPIFLSLTCICSSRVAPASDPLHLYRPSTESSVMFHTGPGHFFVLPRDEPMQPSGPSARIQPLSLPSLKRDGGHFSILNNNPPLEPSAPSPGTTVPGPPRPPGPPGANHPHPLPSLNNQGSRDPIPDTGSPGAVHPKPPPGPPGANHPHPLPSLNSQGPSDPIPYPGPPGAIHPGPSPSVHDEPWWSFLHSPQG